MTFYKIRWHQLRNLGNSKVVRSNYIWIIVIPVFIKLIEAVEIKLLEINPVYKLDIELPFSWIEFFAASVLFAIGMLVYNFRCPDIIKNNSDYSDFQSAGKTAQHLIDYYDSCCQSF